MKPTIFERIENSSKPDFGDVFTKSFDLFQKLFSEALMHGLVSLVVVIPFMILVYVPILPLYIEMLQHAGDPYYTPSAFEDYSVIFIIGWVVMVFVLSFVLQVVTMSINANFYRVCKNKDLGIDEPTPGYFDLLKTHFTKILVLSIAVFGIAVLATLLCYLPIFYVLVPLQIVLPVLAFNEKLSVSDILRASFKLGNKYWLIGFGLFILSSILANLGILICGIGIIVTVYFVHVVVYYFYKDSVGFEEDSEEIMP